MGSYHSHPPSPVVETKYGKIEGRRFRHGDKYVDAYQGIPYAKPPVGELRFKKPQPPDVWDGVLETKKFPNRAIQRDLISWLDTYKKGHQSEDCLYLNVFAPSWKAPPEGFAVMVFIHGGGFSMDTATSYGDKNICETLCTKDIVFVTIQYRLGYLGFFTTGDEECPGNFGLWDQTAALQWIQDNIRAFGGNELYKARERDSQLQNNVTVLGQSAGGASTDFLHLSPHSTNLFHKMIPMAGFAEARWALSPAMVSHSKRKATSLGIEWKAANMMEELRALPAHRFGVHMFYPEKEKESDLECTPVIDGDFLPTSLEELRKRATPKPLMTGVSQLEGLLFMIIIRPSMERLEKLVHRAIPKNLPEREKIVDDFMEKYKPISKDSMSIYRAMNEVYSDLAMNSYALKLVTDTVHNYPDVPVYHYVFSHLNPKSWGPFRWYLPILEASHCLELPYLLGKGIIFGFNFNDDDAKLCESFTTAFTNFAKYGNPNGFGDISELSEEWKPATEDNPARHYKFDAQPHMEEIYFENRPRQLLDLLEVASKL